MPTDRLTCGTANNTRIAGLSPEDVQISASIILRDLLGSHPAAGRGCAGAVIDAAGERAAGDTGIAALANVRGHIAAGIVSGDHLRAGAAIAGRNTRTDDLMSIGRAAKLIGDQLPNPIRIDAIGLGGCRAGAGKCLGLGIDIVELIEAACGDRALRSHLGIAIGIGAGDDPAGRTGGRAIAKRNGRLRAILGIEIRRPTGDRHGDIGGRGSSLKTRAKILILDWEIERDIDVVTAIIGDIPGWAVIGAPISACWINIEAHAGIDAGAVIIHAGGIDGACFSISIAAGVKITGDLRRGRAGRRHRHRREQQAGQYRQRQAAGRKRREQHRSQGNSGASNRFAAGKWPAATRCCARTASSRTWWSPGRNNQITLASKSEYFHIGNFCPIVQAVSALLSCVAFRCRNQAMKSPSFIGRARK